nr:hypothetical protein [Cellulosimicrobium composti]
MVADRDVDEVLVPPGRDLDRRVRLREHRRVLEELGEQVRGVERVVPEHERVDHEVEAHAVVQLDLRRRRTDDVGGRHGLAHATAGVDAREDEERLGVAAHSRREVVEAEEVGQRARVLLGALEVVEERELAVEEHLVAAGDVDEHLGDRATQRGLLAGDADRRLVHVVERGRELADLVRGLHGDRRQVDARSLTRDGDLLDELRELVADVLGRVGEAAQRVDDRAGDEARDEDGEDDGGEGHEDRHDRAGRRGGGEVGRLLLGLDADRVTHRGRLVAVGLRERRPLGRLARGGRAGARAHEVLADLVVRRRRGLEAELAGELAHRGLRALGELVTGRHEDGGLLVGRGALLAHLRGLEHRAGHRLLERLLGEQLVEEHVRVEVLREAAVGRRVGQRARHLERVVDEVPVQRVALQLAEAGAVDGLADRLQVRAVGDRVGQGLAHAGVERRRVEPLVRAVAHVERLVGLLALRHHLRLGVLGRAPRVEEGVRALGRDLGPRDVLRGERRDERARLARVARRRDGLRGDDRGGREEDEDRHREGRKDLPANAQPAEHTNLPPSPWSTRFGSAVGARQRRLPGSGPRSCVLTIGAHLPDT